MKLPADVRQLLQRRFNSQHREWLAEDAASPNWPLDIALGIPSEQAALAQLDATRAWAGAWQSWRGEGTLRWTERRWRLLGTQRVPELLRFDGPRQVACWLEMADRWDRAAARHALLRRRWPLLAPRLGRLFDMLADYPEPEFDRLQAALAWIAAHPDSGLYPRQLPIPGLDSKWIEARKAMLAELAGIILDRAGSGGDFYTLCGLRRPPALLRTRILDPDLRRQVGGIGDLSAPLRDLAQIDLRPRRIVIVENLQTGLALDDMPGTVAFMALGYGVDQLAKIPWAVAAEGLYWGDIDTHGFAILSRARSWLPGLRSILMDEATLLDHRALWSQEPDQHGAPELPQLAPEEQALYRALKHHGLGQAVRLEQERISWELAWQVLNGA